MRALTDLMVMVFALAVVLASVSSAASQTSKPGRDPANIQRRIQKSAELQRQALQALSDPGRAERLVANAWTELKAGHDDMVVNGSNMKFPDPLYPINSKRVERALTHLQGAWDTLKLRDQWSDQDGQVDGVRSNLQQALRLTNTVLATSF